MPGSNGNGSGRRHVEHFLPAVMISQAEALPLRRDMVTLLAYVRDNKVVGTKSTGNLPLKAVREVTACFVEPPVLDVTIGDRLYRLRTETDVWPLYFLHILADVGQLVSAGPGRRWRLTARGNEFLAADAFGQVLFLLATWWDAVNWLVAYPIDAMGDELPPAFELQTLAQLLGCPVGEEIPLESFADDLVEMTGLEWPVPEPPLSPMWLQRPVTPLQRAVQRMVIEIMEKFGVVEANYRYREEISAGTTISRLESFRLTAFGETLLNELGTVYS